MKDAVAIPRYRRGLGLMLLLIWPATILAIGILALDPSEVPSSWRRIATAAILFSVTGTLGAVLVSVMHTSVLRRFGESRSLLPSTGLGIVLGASGGALVSLALNAGARVAAVGIAAGAGALYGLAVYAARRSEFDHPQHRDPAV